MKKLYGCDYTIAFTGNPNVGKTSIFNSLTGMYQHTGNWPGKTVSNAYGTCNYQNKNFLLVDLPGTYSLMSNSTEEEIARDYICFGNPDICVVVVDATCLERNLNLVFQVLEMTPNVIVCVNLLDEAKKKSIKIDLDLLSKLLKVPVVGTIAHKTKTLKNLLEVIYSYLQNPSSYYRSTVTIEYSKQIEEYIDDIQENIKELLPKSKKYLSRWISLKLLDENSSINNALKSNLNLDLENNSLLQEKLLKIKSSLKETGLSLSSLRDSIVSSIILKAEDIRKKTCTFSNTQYNLKNRKIDKILTSKKFGIPIMLLFLTLILWLTITGANYPSALLSNLFRNLQEKLILIFQNLNIPEFWTNIVIFRNVSNCNLGYIRYATSNGNIFSTFYLTRGFRIFT